MGRKISATNKFLSPIFSIILLTVLLFIYATSATGCKSRKNSNDNNLPEPTSEVENESNIDGMGADSKMYAVTDSWYKYKTVNKLVTEVYEKDQLLVKNEYDSDGYRIKKTAGDTVTTFKYDKEYQLITEVCISNKTGTHTLNYTYELQYSDVKGPKYKLTGFTYNEHNYTFKMIDNGSDIIAIYEGNKCVAEYEKENSLLKAVYEFKNGEKVRNDEPDFVGNLNRVLSENQYFYDDETGMFLNKSLIWASAYGNMTYHTREYETPKQTPIIWTPSNGDKYVYNDEKYIEKVINGDRVVEEYRYAEYKFTNYKGVESDISLLSERITNDSVIRYEYFTGDDNTDYQCKIKSITIVINGKEHKLIYNYGYPTENRVLGEDFTSLSVSGFSYNGRNYKFEFANYDSYLITGIIDDKGNKIVSYKIENDGDVYYNRKTYEIKDGVEIENNSPDFIGNLNIVILDGVTYDEECGVNFEAIMYKK